MKKREQCTRNPIILWKTLAKLFISLSLPSQYQVSFSQRQSSAILNTLPPMWEEMLFICHCQCGEFIWENSFLLMIELILNKIIICVIFIRLIDNLLNIVSNLFFNIPFDWKNPIGYLIAVILQLIVTLYSMCYMGSFLSLAFGTFLFTISIAKDLKSILISINKRVNKKPKNSQLLKLLIKFHQLHTDLKQLSN